MTSHALTVATRPLTAAARVLPRVAAPLGGHWRRRLAVLVALAAALAAGYFLWFRDSQFVRVERVRVAGLATAPDAGTLRAELEAAAKRMSTVHVDETALQRIVADSAVVHSIRLEPDFPHGLTVHVTENRPVAMLSGDGKRVPVAADGTLLEGVDVHGALPEVRTDASLPQNGRLPAGGALDRVITAGAAPPELRPKIASITIQPGRGYVAQLTDDGPAIWLGAGARLEAKWDAAAAVLAQRSSAGATYIDVRMPERAVAGGLAIEPPPPEDTEGTDPSTAAPTDGTAPAATAPPADTAATAPQAAPSATSTGAAPAAPDPQPGLEP